MDHTMTSRPLAGAVATVAATAVLLTTATFAPPEPNLAALSPRISTEALYLVALPAVLDTAAAKPAVADATANDLAESLNAIPQALTAGIGSGILGGFLIGGTLALNVIARIPVIGEALSPIVPVIAVIGALVGIPIGAAIGVFSAIRLVASNLGVLPAAASARPAAASSSSSSSRTINTPQRSTKSDPRSNRNAAKTSVKASAPQQNFSRARAGSDRGHNATSNRAARH